MLKGKWAATVSVVLASTASLAAPQFAADVWPYRVQKRAGHLEYLYDLTAVKSGQVAIDVRAEVSRDELKKFLGSLPTQAVVDVDLQDAVIGLSAPEGLERGPLASSFAETPDGPLATGTSIGPKKPARAVPPLHPEMPKVLLSLDAALWKVRQLEDGAIAALELAAESGTLGLPMGRRAFWANVQQKALARHRRLYGDAKDGALFLALKLATAGCFDAKALPKVLKSHPSFAQLATPSAEPTFRPHSVSSFSRDLKCIEARDRALAEALPSSREGTAAALTFLAILDSSPSLQRAYAALVGFRDELYGAPTKDILAQYRTIAGRDGPEGSLRDLRGFFDRLNVTLGLSETAPRPALFAEASNPADQFLSELNEATQAQSLEELALAMQDARVGWKLGPKSPLVDYRDAASLPLVRPETEGGFGDRLFVDSAYRERLLSLFHALRGGHRPNDELAMAHDESPNAGEEPTLKVRLKVPPHLELEPLPAAFASAAVSLGRLEEWVEGHAKASKLVGVNPEGGKRKQPVLRELREARLLVRGLELIARQTVGTGVPDWESRQDDPVALRAAEAFLADWREDPDLTDDVRGLESAFTSATGDTVRAGVFGVGRRELEANFVEQPRLEVTAPLHQADLFELDGSATQRYLIPVLVTGSGGARLVDRARFRAFCDRLGRSRDVIEASMREGVAAHEK